VLRIRARSPAYWKAANLDEFDGVRWRASGSIPPVQPDTEVARGHTEWHQTIRVVLRNITSTQFIGAGTTERILPPAPQAYGSNRRSRREGCIPADANAYAESQELFAALAKLGSKQREALISRWVRPTI